MCAVLCGCAHTFLQGSSSEYSVLLYLLLAREVSPNSISLNAMQEWTRLLGHSVFLFLFQDVYFHVVNISYVCPRSLDLFQIVSYFKKLAKTSWADSSTMIILQDFSTFCIKYFERSVYGACRLFKQLLGILIILVYLIFPLRAQPPPHSP